MRSVRLPLSNAAKPSVLQSAQQIKIADSVGILAHVASPNANTVLCRRQLVAPARLMPSAVRVRSAILTVAVRSERASVAETAIVKPVRFATARASVLLLHHASAHRTVIVSPESFVPKAPVTDLRLNAKVTLIAMPG
jgi:hypothetical protein